VRVFFAAEPTDDTPPKAAPDGETLGAGWFTLDAARGLPMRGAEVMRVLTAVENGCVVYPLSVLTEEGAPW